MFLGSFAIFWKLSLKSVHNFLSYFTNKRQLSHNLLSLAKAQGIKEGVTFDILNQRSKTPFCSSDILCHSSVTWHYYPTGIISPLPQSVSLERTTKYKVRYFKNYVLCLCKTCSLITFNIPTCDRCVNLSWSRRKFQSNMRKNIRDWITDLWWSLLSWTPLNRSNSPTSTVSWK